MRCCEQCFDDNYLKHYIREHGRVGTCQFCRARRTHVIEAADLQELFARFTALYSPLQVGLNVPFGTDAYEIGDRLGSVIQEEWGIFSDRIADSERHHDLLDKILTANYVEEEMLDAPDVNDM